MSDAGAALREKPGTPKSPSLGSEDADQFWPHTSSVSLQGHKGTLEAPMPASMCRLSHLRQDPGSSVAIKAVLQKMVLMTSCDVKRDGRIDHVGSLFHLEH